MESTPAIERFEALSALPDERLDLALGALLASAAMHQDVDIALELERLADMADEVGPRMRSADGPLGQVNVLNEYLFDELGFAGNGEDYYDPRNSMLNEVIERRTGIPITLSLVYIEVGARVDVPLLGVGMPGHFLVRHVAEDSLYIDPFHRGVLLSETECIDQFERLNQSVRWDPSFLKPISNRSFLARMLRNLGAIWVQRGELELAERTLTMLIALQPDEAGHLRDRGMLRYRMGNHEDALVDLEAYIDPRVAGPDVWYVRRLVGRLKGDATGM